MQSFEGASTRNALHLLKAYNTIMAVLENRSECHKNADLRHLATSPVLFAKYDKAGHRSVSVRKDIVALLPSIQTKVRIRQTSVKVFCGLDQQR